MAEKVSSLGWQERLAALRDRWLDALEKDAEGEHGARPSYEIDGAAVDHSGRRVDLVWCVLAVAHVTGQGSGRDLPAPPPKFQADAEWRREVVESLRKIAGGSSATTGGADPYAEFAAALERNAKLAGEAAPNHVYEVTTNG